MKVAQNKEPFRKSSFELFGYDFMIDEMLNVWMLEINKVPNLDIGGS